MSAFDLALDQTLGLEGEWSDESWDPGGRTKWGVTERLAKAYGFDVEQLTPPQAREIYRREFWFPLDLDQVAEVSPSIAAEIFDTAVNTGKSRAVKIAQQALGEVFSYELDVDGRMGPVTLGAIRETAARYEEHLLAALNGFQFAYYLHLLRRGHSAARHAIKGWMRRLSTRWIG